MIEKAPPITSLEAEREPRVVAMTDFDAGLLGECIDASKKFGRNQSESRLAGQVLEQFVAAEINPLDMKAEHRWQSQSPARERSLNLTSEQWSFVESTLASNIQTQVVEKVNPVTEQHDRVLGDLSETGPELMGGHKVGELLLRLDAVPPDDMHTRSLNIDASNEAAIRMSRQEGDLSAEKYTDVTLLGVSRLTTILDNISAAAPE